MLLNLISNALKFSRRDGLILVESGLGKAGEPVISVTDSGAGIEASRLPRIAEPFAAGDNIYTRQKGGTGIGLSITKGLIERHGGRFEIDSEVGRGTTVRLIFPAERAGAAEPAKRAINAH
jgi:two-component system cell cycle sensor histidine kinase PleC